jgi:3-oxoacyl-[acyl-carrier protein] reductase
MFELSGKKALVTGATGGIGAAIARALHGAGAEVAITGRNKDKLQELADELSSNVFIFQADLSEPGAVEDLVSDVADKMGGVDILINNAGLTRDNLSMRMKDEEWQEVLDVNLTVPFRLAKAVQRPMMKSRWGRIINISSVVGTTGNPGQANYCASKAGMAGWTKAVAAELASRGITVNCIAPGFIMTAMTDVLSEEQKQKINSSIPSGRMGTPEDIAACALYLSSEEASYVTGQTVHVNGGMAMV